MHQSIGIKQVFYKKLEKSRKKMSKFFIGATSVFSGTFILASLIYVGVLLIDINNMYQDALIDMKEFKFLANDAWETMVKMNGLEARRLDVNSIFRKSKRSADSKCNCGPQPTNCPAGPPGPPGQGGEPGIDGLPGQAGNNGNDGIPSPIDPYAQQDCIKCPAGAPGPQGADGPVGAPGIDGQPGNQGTPGQPGQNGVPGPQGDSGLSGEPGVNGQPGVDGKNGQRGHGAPGEQGPQGPEGQPGQNGAPGQDGAPGEQGLEGIAGRPGNNGQNGPDGPVGENGVDGAPGADAAYCPCPPRTIGYGEQQPDVEQGEYKKRRRHRV